MTLKANMTLPMRYVPALDGLRGFAVLLVMLFHAAVPGTSGGYLGVDVFFVLSGYLITSLLSSEINATGTVRLSRFYLKRSKRLVPPLLCMLALYLVLAPLAWPKYGYHVQDAWLCVAYLTDLLPVFGRYPLALAHTWSLSVEQHYYLLWPLVVLAISRIRREWRTSTMFALYILTTAWRASAVISGKPWVEVYFRFDFRLSGLMLGSCLASALQHGPALPDRLWKGIALLAPAGAACIIFMSWGDKLGLLIGSTLAELFAATLILATLTPSDRPLQRLLALPAMVYLGRISYGLYLYHHAVLAYLRDRYSWVAAVGIGMPLSFLLAVVSYHSIEAIGRERLAIGRSKTFDDRELEDRTITSKIKS